MRPLSNQWLLLALIVPVSCYGARNNQKFASQSFSTVDLGAAASDPDQTLYNACANFPVAAGTNPVLQVEILRPGQLLLCASHFDYSAELRDMALVVCDNPGTPLYKNIDFAGAYNSKDGWVVQGSVPSIFVHDPVFMVVSNLAPQGAYFRIIPYTGPDIQLFGPDPYTTVSNILSLTATITDLTGAANDQFTVTVDGNPARYTLGVGNTISLNTIYNPNGYCNVIVNGNSAALAAKTNNSTVDAKPYFLNVVSLPLDFENDTFLAFQSDNASPDIGTNHIVYSINKPQLCSVKIWNPASGQVMFNATNFFSEPGYISVPWNFTLANGVTPYTNDTYAVTFIAYDPATINITNSIARQGVRNPAGCFMTYMWEDPSMLDGQYLNDQADSRIYGDLATLYNEVYKYNGFTQYTPDYSDPNGVGTNRNHGGCTPYNAWLRGWDRVLGQNITNRDYSDLTLGPAHGSGSAIGGQPGGYIPDSFDPNDLHLWTQVPGPNGHNWRLRKTCLWTCYSGCVSLANVGGAYDAWPDACGISVSFNQYGTLCQKNAGLFFAGPLVQRGYNDKFSITTATPVVQLDQTWMCGNNQYPGGCDPTYSFDFAINATRGRNNPQLDWANPVRIGYGLLIYTSRYDNEAINCVTTHVKTR